jgi:3-oxoacyl-[acyl-carrier protein] reductase
VSTYGPHIDILVNNAGINKPTPIESLTQEDFSDMFDTNVRAAVFMTQAVLPHLGPQNARIINIGSTAARVGVPGISLYTSSKLAVEALTRSWAAELGDRGVTVNTVAPGSTQSDLLASSADASDLNFEAQRTPIERRIGTPSDIAQVVAWLASDDSKWITGQCICASGGYRMY